MIACSNQMFYTNSQMINHLLEHLAMGVPPGSKAAAIIPQIDRVQLSSAASNKTSSILFSELDDICRSQKGDSEAYRRLIERYQSHIGRLLWRFTRDKNCHEELVQETFVQAYLSLHTYKSQAPFEHWLTRIATRTGYRFWKQSNRHQHLSLEDGQWEQTAAVEPDAMTPEQAAEIVHRLLAQLPPRDRLVLTLRYLEQCDVEETARRTGWSQTLVKVQTHRAKQKLKALLDKSNIQFEID